MKFAIIIPVYNEAATLEKVLNKLSRYKNADLVIVDDGSTDATPSILERIHLKGTIRHPENRGYGRSLIDGFEFVKANGYRYCVTMDADEQHEPDYVPCFVEKLEKFDIVSGSRYLNPLLATDHPPADRLEVNKLITEKLRTITGYPLTDSFCGFKGYRVEALRKIELTEPNYGFPIQFWLRAAKAGFSFTELAVPLIYKDYSRNFNDQFAGRDERLNHYLRIIEQETQGSIKSVPRKN